MFSKVSTARAAQADEEETGFTPYRVPVNAKGEENDSNIGVQRGDVSARPRTSWGGVNLRACFLLFTVRVLSCSTWHLGVLGINVESIGPLAKVKPHP